MGIVLNANIRKWAVKWTIFYMIVFALIKSSFLTKKRQRKNKTAGETPPKQFYLLRDSKSRPRPPRATIGR